jgi:murein DD-endopeptidase MepM/ murein hydrolase activator NlpD
MTTRQEEKIAIVKAGDTLGLIAKRHGITYQELAAYNRLTNADQIIIGQHLRIPKPRELGVVKFRLFDLIGEAIEGLECKVLSLGEELMRIKTDAKGALPDIQAKHALQTFELWVKRYATNDFKKVGEVKGGTTSRIVAVKSGKQKIVTQTKPAEEKHVTKVVKGGAPKKSGVDWLEKFPHSTDIGMLEAEFGKDLQAFIGALKEGGILVTITTTFRPPQRSYLMYWCQQIAAGKVSPDKVKPFVPEVEGDELVNIDWAHLGSDGQPDLEAAKKAAEEMRVKFLIGTNAVAKPYRSNHNFRQAKAVDMTLVPKWGIGKVIKNKDRKKIEVEEKKNLFLVGQSYGVVHFDLRPNKSVPRQDDVHWSRTGA